MEPFNPENLKRSTIDKPAAWAQCLSFIDLTALNATDTPAQIGAMTEKVNRFPAAFPHFPHVAAICVYPALVPVVKQQLQLPGVQIAAVGAGFPASQTFIEVKCDECKRAVDAGAHEIDVVISLGTFLAGDHHRVQEELVKIKAAIGHAHLKVILETGALTPEQIRTAGRIAIEAGADFIKTSTGKMEPAATPEAAWIMAHVIKAHYLKTGKKTGLKPAGGIVTASDALLYYAIVKEVLGEEWLTPSLFRLGASRLANNLLTELLNTPVKYF
ncbi:MAG: deoxyribose-phosphate aldolase [Prevotellaceae bacterium]|jgi:deoxyribose-phosphate aldolase|nr:deoxyribose-phosphate aldolase [Prevotellaceae bacterium]